jgi:hypothetical protein
MSVTTGDLVSRHWIRVLSVALVLFPTGCGRYTPSVGFDGNVRPPDDLRGVALDGRVGGRIKAPEEGTKFTSVLVELVQESPYRVVSSVRSNVDESYRIDYPSSLLNCERLAVRFTTSDGYVRDRPLPRCGIHRVDYTLPTG